MRNVKKIISLMIFAAFCIDYAFAGGQPTQIFVETEGKGKVGKPLGVKIYMLDEYGNVAKNFNELEKINVKVNEETGKVPKSYSINAPVIRFQNGIGKFFIKDKEPEDLTVEIKTGRVRLASRVKIVFSGEDEIPPRMANIRLETPAILFLEFDEKIDSGSSDNEKQYKAVTNKKEIYPDSVEYRGNSVILKFPAHFSNDEEGYIEVEGIKDLNGNEIEPGTRSPDFKGDCNCAG